MWSSPSHDSRDECICTSQMQIGRRVQKNPECPKTGHWGPVRSVDCSPDGECVVSGSDDKLVKIWDAKTGAEVSSFV